MKTKYKDIIPYSQFSFPTRDDLSQILVTHNKNETKSIKKKHCLVIYMIII